MPLSDYRRKRRSGRGPEPGDGRKRRASADGPRFVIQHHAARSDHYDFRLEINGVLVSWAVPRGPSTNPKDMRMARRTEDHPLEDATFEGVIPKGEYGAIVWDHGTYESDRKLSDGLAKGHLSFQLHGKKLRGGYALTKIRDEKDETWLLVKRNDEGADARR
jgi:DNA ligase D-like protein (predicted 3'-phosphoesterase)